MAGLVVPNPERGIDRRLLQPIYPNQLLARALAPDDRDVRRSNPELLRHEATESFVRAALLRRGKHASHNPPVVRRS